MTDSYTMQWVGWNNTMEKGVDHDKVWGWFTMKDGREWCLWGRRGKQLRFKHPPSPESVRKVTNTKDKK